MPKDKEQPTQQTDKGLIIPVPTRDEIDDAFAKIAKPAAPPQPKGSRRRWLRRSGE